MSVVRPAYRQRGIALWMLLIALILAGSYAFYRTANHQLTKTGQQNRLTRQMALVKEALLARAVTDDNRPGSLPCPDLMTDSAGFHNVPNDGKADFFIGAANAQCPSYVGWLPWVTLDLAEPSDDTGTRLWYVLAPNLRDDDSAQPINSNTATGLSLDGNTDIAALIIAPGAPLAGQNRPSNLPADYLDGANGNGDDHVYVSGPAGNNFNDTVLAITRQELMAAVEKRVANEVRSCLDQHAAAPANADHRYPWPAPFSASSQQGKAGSLFGRVPLSQPEAGLGANFQASLLRITQTQTQLSTASDANQQLSLLNILANLLLQARNQFDVLYSVTNQLKQTADNVLSPFNSIASSVATATANGRISRTEGSALRTLTGNTDSALNTLTSQLEQFGIDPFPWELAQLSSAITGAGSPSTLLDAAQVSSNVLYAANTPRSDIGPVLAATQTAATNALLAAQASAADPRDAALFSAAKNAAVTLNAALQLLKAAVEASRVSILAVNLGPQANLLESVAATLRGAQNAANVTTLQQALNNAQTVVSGIVTGVAAVISTRDTANSALVTAINITNATPANYAGLDAATLDAIAKINALTAAIQVNESVSNNLTLTSLEAAIASYDAARTAFIAQDTASPRPTQRTITPYATNLGNATVDIVLWAKIISDNAALIAPLAKANPLPAGTDPTTAAILDGSGYKLSQDALNSIVGKNAAAQLLQAYISNPSPTSQAAAMAALAQTNAILSQVLAAVSATNSQLGSTTASALPIIWLSSQCDFLRPTGSSWWSANQWADLTFYQIGDPLNTAPGKLLVNGTGSYRVVTLAAGRALTGQNRSTQTSANYFEGINADPSRDGDASAPVTRFTAGPPSATFNDRLSY